MGEIVWYRSLYWRIAIGFVVLLATLLAAQALFSLWLGGRIAAMLPGRTPAQFAEAFAADLSLAISEVSSFDLAAYLKSHRPNTSYTYAVALADGQSATSEPVPPPPNASRAARMRLGSLIGSPGPGGRGADFQGQPPPPPRAEGFGRRGDGRGPRDGFGRGGDARDGRGGRGGPSFEFASITTAGEVRGIVAVTAEQPPLQVALRGFLPTLASAGVFLLVAGTTAAALLVFRPAHRRLRALEQAARQIGAGDASARAIEAGGDEVASLARTFNEMAEDLHSREVALVASDRTRRQLLADISHELATPLAAIRGYAETLSMPDVGLDEPTRLRYLQVITDETDRLSRIVGDLLDLARLEGGGVPLERAEVSVAALFARVEHRHEPLLRERAITLATEITPPNLTVPGDPGRLEQVLQNLAANAVRHTPDGGRIVVRGDRDGDQVRLVVEDSGAGIPAQHLPHVFDRFYKADASRTGTPIPSGSGLGLSIVQAIVERHGGRVSATNGASGGARFEVLLPAQL